MNCKLNKEELFDLVNHQINVFWPLNQININYRGSLEIALKRLEKNFLKRNSNIFQYNGEAIFDIRHSVQYCIFLYLYANQLFLDGNINEANTVYYLNKIMNSVDWFYEVNMPEYFGAEHPLSSVVGRAEIDDFLFLYQGTTIGGNWKDNKLYYPVVGKYVSMYSDSKILGDSIVGDYVIVAANTYILNEKIPNGCIVFGQSPNLIIKKKKESEILDMIKHIWILN